jgi:hypothetical protein
MKLPPWSYSSIKLFDQCPRKYYHLKVVKDFKEDQNAEHLLYGTRFHKAAEEYIRDDTPLPEGFKFVKGALDSLKRFPGQRHCEYEMGLTENLDPCGFKAEDVWFRGIADLLIIDAESGDARIVDYKTGKSAKYADTGQLELMALAVFKHFPMVKRVKAGLLFVIANAFPKASYSIDQAPVMWQRWIRDHERLKMAHKTGVWNPKPSGLCRKHCVVLSCPHNGRTE